MLRTTFLLVLALFVNSCSNEIDSSNQNLDKLINTDNKSVVHLDNKEVLSITPSMIINNLQKSSEKVIGRPISTVVTHNKILVADQLVANIKVFDRKGKYIQSIGKKGKGPGKFGFLKDLAANKDYLFSTDLSNQRMQIYDHTGALIETKNISIPLIGNTSAGQSNIFIPSNQEGNNLLSVYDAQEPFRRQTEFMPLVIPKGNQPKGYNNVKSATNKSGTVVASYPALPYLFIFDASLKYKHMIELKGKSVSSIVDENPPLEPVPELQDPMVKNIIGPLAMDSKGSIFFGIGRTGYVLKHKQGKYKLSKIFQIDASGIGDHYSKPLGLYEFTLDPEGDFLIHTSPHHNHIFGVKSSKF